LIYESRANTSKSWGISGRKGDRGHGTLGALRAPGMEPQLYEEKETGDQLCGEEAQNPGVLMFLGQKDLSWVTDSQYLETDVALLQQCSQIICFVFFINISLRMSTGRDLDIKHKNIFYGA
jgi:hypothetical protein